MNKKIFALATGLILVAAGSGIFTVMRISATPAPPPPTLFSYAAKWICNFPTSPPITPFDPNAAEKIGLVPGEYKTDINVHNPSNATTNLTLQKKFVLSTPETSPSGGVAIFVITMFTLHPDAAIFIDCNEILFTLLNSPAGQTIISNGGAAKGFVVITTNTSFLDVVAEYSQIGFNCINVPTCTPVGSSLDVERVPARPFVP